MANYFLCAAMTTVSAWTSFVFSFRTYRKAKRANSAELTSTMYVLTRSFALAFFSMLPLVIESGDMLTLMALLMVTVQGFDAVVGFQIRSKSRTLIPVMIALINAVLLMLAVS